MISFENECSDEDSKIDELQRTPKKSILEDNFIPPKLLLNNNWNGFNKLNNNHIRSKTGVLNFNAN
jgi:hypothetical protein